MPNSIWVRAELGQAFVVSEQPPALIKRLHGMGMRPDDDSPRVVQGLAWLPPVTGRAYLDFSPNARSLATLVPAEPESPDAPVRRFAFTSVIPRAAEASHRIRARLGLDRVDMFEHVAGDHPATCFDLDQGLAVVDH